MSVDEVIKKMFVLRDEVGETSSVRVRVKGDDRVFQVVDVFHGVGDEQHTFVMLEIQE